MVSNDPLRYALPLTSNLARSSLSSAHRILFGAFCIWKKKFKVMEIVEINLSHISYSECKGLCHGWHSTGSFYHISLAHSFISNWLKYAHSTGSSMHILLAHFITFHWLIPSYLIGSSMHILLAQSWWILLAHFSTFYWLIYSYLNGSSMHILLAQSLWILLAQGSTSDWHTQWAS